ncbi:hypothetical protein EMCRGX_G019895 [Ephydatia muelleri]
MALLGKIQEFEPGNESMSAYLERVELFMAANAIAEERKVTVFLSTVGPKTYGLLRNLVAPSKPQDKSMLELTAVLKKHFEPKPIVIAERFYFHRRNQAVGESIAEYVAELRRLAMNCKFGAYLDEAMRDRLVCGLRDEDTQKKLLSEEDLTFARAAEIAQSREAAQLNVQQLKETSVAVKTVSSRVDKQFRRCPHCGKNNHSSEKCSFKSATCYKCRKPGHIASVCRQKYVAGLQWMEPQDTDVEAYLGTVMTVGRDLVQPITIDVKLNGRPLKMELRTRLDLLKPDYGDKALGKQADQKNYHDLHSRDRQFSVGQKVMARNFLQGLTWVPGVVTEVCGPVSYMVRVQPNIVWRRHVDHIKELQEFDALRGGEEDSLRKEPVLENCAEETSIVDKPSASDSVISAGVPQEGLCPDIQVPTTEIAVQQDPGSTSDISIEQSRSAELREPSKSTELGREIATRGDVPKLASRGSGSEDHQQQTAQPEGVRRYPKREHRPPKRY